MIWHLDFYTRILIVYIFMNDRIDFSFFFLERNQKTKSRLLWSPWINFNHSSSKKEALDYTNTRHRVCLFEWQKINLLSLKIKHFTACYRFISKPGWLVKSITVYWYLFPVTQVDAAFDSLFFFLDGKCSFNQSWCGYSQGTDDDVDWHLHLNQVRGRHYDFNIIRVKSKFLPL